MNIIFDYGPDETGLGLIIVDNRFYGVPAKAVLLLDNAVRQRDELLAALVEIQQVACSGSPELAITTAAIKRMEAA
jgi:hypothetical protein